MVDGFDHLDVAARRVSRGDLWACGGSSDADAEMDRLQGHVRRHDHPACRPRRASIAAQVDDERRNARGLQSLAAAGDQDRSGWRPSAVLVSGCAHELNNPCRRFLGFSELLADEEGRAGARARGPDVDPERERPAPAPHPNLSRFGRPDFGATPTRLHDVVASGDGAPPAQARRAEHQNRARRAIKGHRDRRSSTELQQVC
jgi:hypothetical protein